VHCGEDSDGVLVGTIIRLRHQKIAFALFLFERAAILPIADAPLPLLG
jgi:hypothetical protein